MIKQAAQWVKHSEKNIVSKTGNTVSKTQCLKFDLCVLPIFRQAPPEKGSPETQPTLFYSIIEISPFLCLSHFIPACVWWTVSRFTCLGVFLHVSLRCPLQSPSCDTVLTQLCPRVVSSSFAEAVLQWRRPICRQWWTCPLVSEMIVSSQQKWYVGHKRDKLTKTNNKWE